MSKLDDLFSQNMAWAESVKASRPDHFINLSQKHAPKYLWLGCSDSRVNPAKLLNLPAHEIFVHRNIANLVSNQDINVMSVVQYAVEALSVKHIVICGHRFCGGIKAVLDGQLSGPIREWLKPVVDLKASIEDRLDQFSNEQRCDELCKQNVIQQVINVCNSSTVQGAWKQGEELFVHGWVYDLETGLLNSLISDISSNKGIPSIAEEYF